MRASEVMTRNVATLAPHATVQEAAQMMDQLNIGAVPVCEGRKLVGMVTDWDCWREAEAGAEASEVIRVMAGNARIALDMLGHFARALPATREPSPIDRALDGAIVTHPAARDPALVARLGAVAGRVLRPASGA